MTAALLMAGSAAAQTGATSAAAAQPGPSSEPLAEKAAAAAQPARTERVCKAESIANSRLKKKKVCMSRTEYERVRNAQKQMVREQMDQGGAQANQGGG